MTFEKEFDQTLLLNDTKVLSTFLEKHRKEFFSSHKIKMFYDQIKHIKLDTNESKLTYAWLALLSGDNLMMYTVSTTIEMNQLSPVSQALFYQLKALSGVFGEPEKRLEYCKKSFDMLNDKDPLYYKANGLLTQGQIQVGLHQLREGANSFYEAYQLFIADQMLFPASVSLTNALLNWFRLGEFKHVLTLGEQALMLSSQVDLATHSFWNIVSLPLGMCYFEQNKISLAIDLLNKAYQSINDMKLIHMHGYVEIYLIRSYYLSDQKEQLEKLVQEVETLFSTMHYPMMSIITAYGHFLLNRKITKAEIENLEMIYNKSEFKHPLLIEMLAVLYLENKSSILSLDLFENHVKQARFEGDVVNLFLYLLLLAERYYSQKEIKASQLILEEAMTLSQRYHLETSFHLHPYTAWPMIQKLNPKIKPLHETNELLTTKEKDILLLISQGKSNEEIGDILFISIGTVKWHINHILSKLYAKNRMQAVEIAKSKQII